jgi:hypothetical protein
MLEQKKRHSEQQTGSLTTIRGKENRLKNKKSLLSLFLSSEERPKLFLFHTGEEAGLEEALELLRFASSLRTRGRKVLLAPQAMHPFFASSQLFEELYSLKPDISKKALSQFVHTVKADFFISSESLSIRKVTCIQLKSRSRSYHRFPSFWKALPFWNGKGRGKNQRKSELVVSAHHLRFRITMRRMFESLPPAKHPLWIPVSLDPFTGSPWPFSNYMRLCRMLSQNGIPFVVTLDQKSARSNSEKDRQVLQGLSVFRKELALLSRSHNGIRLVESPSFEELLSLARFSNIVIGNPSPELLLAQLGGAQIIFLHDMLTYRSLNLAHPESVSVHASYGRSLFEESVHLGGGISLKPHVEECVRDCPACSHRYCVDMISPEAVFEELRGAQRI